MDQQSSEIDGIIARVRSGETAVFAHIIRQYESVVWKIAAMLLRDWTATENLVQQIFIDAYTHLDQYQLGTDFGAWLRTLARNRIRKELRTIVREDRRLHEYWNRLSDRLKSESTVNDDSSEFMVALRDCRSGLEDDDQRLIRLRYERGLPFETIAKQTQSTSAAVQRMISRIRLKLRSCIQGKLNPL